jgi:lipid-binding SYLF domain-containing protein
MRLNIMNKLIPLFSAFLLIFSQAGFSASKAEIDVEIKAALDELYKTSPEAKELSAQAKGILVFPSIVKAGLVIGGAYGEGALIIDGKKAQYYNNIAGSIGFQLGVEKRSEVYMFLKADALKEFRNASGWSGGGDASVAVAVWGAGGVANVESIKEPVVAFVFSPKGLMYNLTLEGSKINKIDK